MASCCLAQTAPGTTPTVSAAAHARRCSQPTPRTSGVCPEPGQVLRVERVPSPPVNRMSELPGPLCASAARNQSAHHVGGRRSGSSGSGGQLAGWPRFRRLHARAPPVEREPAWADSPRYRKSGPYPCPPCRGSGCETTVAEGVHVDAQTVQPKGGPDRVAGQHEQAGLEAQERGRSCRPKRAT